MSINFYHQYFLNRTEKFTPKYIVIILVLLTIIIIILFIPYSNNITFNGKVIHQDNKYYVLTQINDEDIKLIKNNCIIDNHTYKCTINKIEKSDNQYLVLLDIKLDDEYLIENYPIKIKLKMTRETLFERIIKKRKGGNI